MALDICKIMVYYNGTWRKAMGNVFAEITIKNCGDVTNVQRGIAMEQDVRSLDVRALVDTGAVSLVINEDICRKLGLAVKATRTATLADGGKVDCKITEPVWIHWKDRDAVCQAVVLPGADVLLGVIPLEFMDLIVDPVAEQLVGAHGDRIISRIV
jgi:clan AA aspartic protease